MFWDKKKKDERGLPDLPLPKISTINLKDFERPKEEIHSLPSFPNTSNNRNFMNSAIKDAVSSEEQEDLTDELPEASPHMPEMSFPRKNRFVEMEEWTPEQKSFPKPMATKDEPIFIKLEKYHNIKSSMNAVEKKMYELETVLAKIKETKAKEESELIAWEKEMHSLKAHISSVNNDVFGKA